MASQSTTVFSEIEEGLRASGLLDEPAEIHGELCGLSCIMGADAGPAWAAQVLADSQQVSGNIRDLLEELARTTWSALDAGDMNLRLLLPGDDSALEQRAEHLGLWCQGFIHGLGAAAKPGPDSPLLSNEVTSEIINDFTQISRAAFMAEETEEEGEAAYMELVEYVRVSVQLSFEELYRLRRQPEQSQRH